MKQRTFVLPWQGVPLLYVPLEIIMSKYYGESERLLGKVFSLANELPNGAIIFLDEVVCPNIHLDYFVFHFSYASCKLMLNLLFVLT